MNKFSKTVLRTLPIIAIATGGFFAFKAISYRPPVKPREQSDDASPLFVRSQKVVLENNTLSKKLWAKVKPLHSVSLRSEVSGRIIAMPENLKPGLVVAKGQTLATIDTERLKAQEAAMTARQQAIEMNQLRLLQELRNLESELTLAKKQVKIASDDSQRFQQLARDNAASQTQVANYQQVEVSRTLEYQRLQNRKELIPIEIKKLGADKEQIKAELSTIQRDIKDAIIKAPFSGILQNPIRQKGDWLRTGDILCQLESHEQIELWTTLALSDLQAFKPGPYNATFFDQQEQPNIQFSRTLGSADERLQTETLIFRIDDNKNLSFNAIVPLLVSKKMKTKTVRLPNTSLKEGNTVFVIENAQLVRRQVEVALEFNGEIFIKSGLRDGERVVTSHLEGVRAGQKVKVEPKVTTPTKS